MLLLLNNTETAKTPEIYTVLTRPALSHATTELERSIGNLKLGEVYLKQKQFELAKAKFQEAVKHNPELESSVDAAV